MDHKERDTEAGRRDVERLITSVVPRLGLQGAIGPKHRGFDDSGQDRQRHVRSRQYVEHNISWRRTRRFNYIIASFFPLEPVGSASQFVPHAMEIQRANDRFVDIALLDS